MLFTKIISEIYTIPEIMTIIQALIDLGMVSIGLAHARRMGILRYENNQSIIVEIRYEHQLISFSLRLKFNFL